MSLTVNLEDIEGSWDDRFWWDLPDSLSYSIHYNDNKISAYTNVIDFIRLYEVVKNRSTTEEYELKIPYFSVEQTSKGILLVIHEIEIETDYQSLEKELSKLLREVFKKFDARSSTASRNSSFNRTSAIAQKGLQNIYRDVMSENSP